MAKKKKDTSVFSTQKDKTKFRRSKKWTTFRKHMRKKQSTDPITNYPLRAGCNLHHLDLNPNNYQDLSNESHFVFLNKQTHETIHWLFNYYQNDKDVLNRVKDMLDKMLEFTNTYKHLDNDEDSHG